MTDECIRSCGNCTKIYAKYFEKEKWVEACRNENGATIPDCQNMRTITRFINKIDKIDALA